MSLLLDALKRAEQEKLARQGLELQAIEPAATEAPAAEPAVRPEPRRKPEPAPAVSAPAPTGREREGAKAVFAAKQPETIPTSPAAGRSKAIAVIAIAAVALLAAGSAYVWYEINVRPSPIARAPMAVSSPKPVKMAPSASPQPAPNAAGAATPAAVPPVAVLKPERLSGTPARPAAQSREAEQLVMGLLNDSAGARPAPPLKLSRTIEPPRVAPDVLEGYEALKNGDAVAARRHYEAAVAADATSVDAHLGLAAAAARAGDRATATRHYRRALALDPKNPSAVAGLAALADFSHPDRLEVQLRADIAQYPRSPALQFTLGNLYASQARWNEAQAAYFEAYRLDPDSADLAYNLAVSLDHLGKAKLAADFYQRALAATRQQAALFDKGQVSRRIAELKPQ
jgi:tetratricopeptide (TPR) repeat protein